MSRKDTRRPGRPTKYSPDIANEICRRIAEGEPLTKICREEAMPGYSPVLGWRVISELGFSELYARARLDAADTLADEIRELAKRVEEGKLDPNAGKVTIDALKWIASKLKPKAYGDHRHVELGGGVAHEFKPSDHCPEWLRQLLTAPAVEATQQTKH